MDIGAGTVRSGEGRRRGGPAAALLRTYLRALAPLRAERGVAVRLVLANLAIAAAQLLEPVLFGAAIDAITRQGPVLGLVGLWALLGAVGITAGVVVALSADRLAHRRRAAAMADAFERVIALPLDRHASAGSARLVSTLQAGADTLFAIWLGFFREHLAAVAGIALLVPTAFAMDARLAGLLALLAAVYGALNLHVIRRTQAGQRAAEGHHRDVYGRVGDAIGNAAVLQAYARLAAEAAGLRALMGRMLEAQRPVLAWWAVLTILTRAAATIAMIAVLALGAALARDGGGVSAGEVVSFIGFAGLLVGRLDQVTSLVGRLFVQAPAVDAFFDLLAERPAVPAAPGVRRPPRAVEGRVAFERVTYRFPGTDQGVSDLTFEAGPGRTVALVGPTGAGKSTTLALLQRLREPDAGRVTLDGVDARDIDLDSLRGSMAVVFQEAGLLNRSILDNLLVGRPDATRDEVEDAARRAEAHDFILAKPGGYGFVVGERGAALSGGERQRLAIARALLKDAPVLLLDEATSALDPATARRVRRAIDAARAGRTTLVIAHQLATVADADLILVLERGRIVERGRFAELAAAEGPFSRLLADGRLVIPA